MKFLTLLLGLMALLPLSARADERTAHAIFTPDVIEGIVRSGQYESTDLTDAEARERATAAGIHLPTVDNGKFEHPWFIIRAGIGLPSLVSVHVEIFLHRNWTVEVGGGWGLLPSAYEGSIRWRPDATCWGCDGKNAFSIGFGLDPSVYLPEVATGSLGVMVS